MRMCTSLLQNWKVWWMKEGACKLDLFAWRVGGAASRTAMTEAGEDPVGTIANDANAPQSCKRGEGGSGSNPNIPFEIRRLDTAGSRTSGSPMDTWKEWFLDCPPVSIAEGGAIPTALQWARRRGPEVPESLICKLFRKRSVRTINHVGKLKRVGASDPLPVGSILLLPKSSIEDSHHKVTRKKSTKHVEITQAQRKWARSMLLHIEEDFLVLNKPAGVPVQGGSKVTLSIDQLLEPVFCLQESDKPRLVHRLDKDTSGCLLVARNPDAAAWISAAFRQRTKEAHRHRHPGNIERPKTFVERTYWAVCETRNEGEEIPQAGLIDIPLRMLGSETGKQKMASALDQAGQNDDGLHAVSSYRMLKQEGGLSILKLWPHTGRKHQLRAHCTFGLDAPIVGDRKYGWSSSKTAQFLPKHPKLHLHCRKIKLRCPDGKEVEVTCPFPVHMQKTLSMLGLKTPT